MNIRKAEIEDINQIQSVRNSVRENKLSNPSVITNAMCRDYITNRGCGWVCEINDLVTGFSIVDLKDNNVWALFIRPEFERSGIGRSLHDIMLNWYFGQTTKNVWLSTSPNTRAELFYRKAGWTEIGSTVNREIKFEMSFEYWKNNYKR